MSNRREILVDLVTFAVGFGIILLMESPAARQLLVMRTTRAAKRFCQGQADFWQSAALSCSQAYNRARL